MLSFWCSTVDTPWTWAWRSYPGIWLTVLAIAAPYFVAVRRRRRRMAAADGGVAVDAAGLAGGANGSASNGGGAMNGADGNGGTSGADGGALDLATLVATRKQVWLFTAGVLTFWLATDWPLGLLGASYLASAHMVQFLLYTLAAAPLMMMGTPEWMARRLLSNLRLYRISRRIARPVFAGVTFNLILIATHSPWAVDILRANQIGSFLMDMIWLASGFLVWLPILSPLSEHHIRSYPAKMVYLFASLGVVPAVPAGFLTFASFPLYSIYELAPRFYGLSAANDQQMAGLIMKLGGIPLVWGMILVMMFRWSDESRAQGVADRAAAAAAAAERASQAAE